MTTIESSNTSSFFNNNVENIQEKIIKLKNLKDKIEGIGLFHQNEILRILHNNNISINENKNGVFINLSYVPDNVIDVITNYMTYVSKQECQLNEIEEEKQKITKTFFK